MMRWSWGLLDWGVRYLVFSSLLLSVANPVFATPRTALVIGNGGYQEGRLRNPPNDARDMAAKLKELGFTVIDEYDADRRRMRRVLRKFEDELRRSGGVGLFYFAGHGVQVKNRNYLIPIGADIRREFEVPDEALESGAVLRAMQSAGNDLNIVILDACRDNPFARSFRTATRGLARLETENTRGVFVAYATGPGQVAADGDKRNSPYTRHLLANRDGKIRGDV